MQSIDRWRLQQTGFLHSLRHDSSLLRTGVFLLAAGAGLLPLMAGSAKAALTKMPTDGADTLLMLMGSKAALFYPTWPDMNGQYIPDVMVEKGSFNIENFINYDKNTYFSAWIQFMHRNVAYILTFSILSFIIFYWKRVDSASYKLWLIVLVSLLITQVLLGIFTLKNSIYQIPVNLGVAHQAVALLLLTTMLIILFFVQTKKL